MSNAFNNAAKLRGFVSPTAISGAGLDAAILSLDASAGGTVVLPPGEFTLSPLVYTSRHNINIVGAGMESTKLKLSGAGTALTFSGCQWLTMRHLTVELAGTAQGTAATYGVRLDAGSSNATFERVLFQGFAEDGLQLVGTAGTPLSGIKVDGCYFLGNGSRQLYSQYSNDYHYTRNQFGRLAGIGLADFGAFLNESSAGIYAENYHWDNGIGCVNNSANYATVVNNRFEESQTNGYYQNGGTNLIFTGNKIHTNSKASSGVHDGVYMQNVIKYLIDDNQVFSFDATRHDNDFNIDTGCEDGVIGKNSMSSYTNSPMRIAGGFTLAPSTSHGFSFVTAASKPQNDTAFLGAHGESYTEGAVQVLAQRKCLAVRLYCASSATPGSGQTYTYTLRKNASDTAIVATITNGNFAAATMGPATPILFGTDDAISVKVVSSATAAAGYHRVMVQLVEY